MTRKEIDRIIREVYASSRLEGYKLPYHVVLLCKRILKGEITADEAISSVTVKQVKKRKKCNIPKRR